MSRHRTRTAVVTESARAAACALLFGLTLAAFGCGDDDDPSGQRGTGGDGDAATPMDGGRDAGPGSGTAGGPGRPPRADAGRDAATSSEAGPDPDEDGGIASCGALDCRRLDDACNTYACDPATLECRAQPRPNGTTCGSATLDNCTAPDTCQAGVCVDNDRAAGTPCGDQNVDCRVDDACDGNGQCVDNGLRPQGTACGSQIGDDCTAPDSCDALGACRPNHVALDTPCTDLGHALGTLCNHDDRCDGNGQCVDQGVWTAGSCPLGETTEGCLCGRTGPLTQCLPGPDVCVAGACLPGHELYAPEGAGGTTDTLPCGDEGVSECDAADSCLNGTCQQNPAAPGTGCGDQATDTTCDGADSCDGFGNCEDNVAPFNTVCGELPGECWLEPRCDGGGSCQAAQPVGPGTACGDSAESACDHADTCDGTGDCQSNWESPGSACGDESSTACTAADTCDATGDCQPNHAASGTACGDQGVTCVNDDACDGDGFCTDNGVTSPCTIRGVVLANGVAQAGVAVELVGLAESTTTNADGQFELQAPLLEDVLLRIGDAPGYWGVLEVRAFSPQDGAELLEWNLIEEADIASPASSVGLSVDDAKGLVMVTFSGNRTGMESAALTQDSAMPIRPTDTGFEYGSDIGSPEGSALLFYNTEPGMTGITVTSGSTNTCALAAMTVTQYPVFARTLTSAAVDCE